MEATATAPWSVRTALTTTVLAALEASVLSERLARIISVDHADAWEIVDRLSHLADSIVKPVDVYAPALGSMVEEVFAPFWDVAGDQ
jgi:hypothetical protein